METTEKKLDEDAVIRLASKGLDVDEQSVRDFVERNNIDAVALYEEKVQMAQREELIARRFMLGRVPGAVSDFTIGPKEVSS